MLRFSLERFRAALLAIGACSVALLVGSPSTAPADSNVPARSAAGAVVLGSKLYAPRGEGFGTVAPATIFNGGVPSGLVTEISWQNWGAPAATGTGLTSVYMPQGGYYPDPGAIQLFASEIAKCRKRNGKRGKQLAYRQLYVSVVEYPGGPFGETFKWSGTRSICRFK